VAGAAAVVEDGDDGRLAAAVGLGVNPAVLHEGRPLGVGLRRAQERRGGGGGGASLHDLQHDRRAQCGEGNQPRSRVTRACYSKSTKQGAF